MGEPASRTALGITSTVAGTTFETELSYVSGVDSTGSAAASNWWQTQASFPGKWGSSTPGTTGGVVTYGFATDDGAPLPWYPSDQSAISAGLALWSTIANIRFVQIPYSSTTPPQITFHYRPDGISQTGTAERPVGTAAAPYTIGTYAAASTTFDPPQLNLINPFGQLGSFTWSGGYGMDTILHEEGRLLGLGGSGPYNGSVNPATQQLGPYDTRLWTVMSYISPSDPTASYHSYYDYPAANWGRDQYGYPLVPTTWMPLDILAAQRLYGKPVATPLSGGQVFGFHCNLTGPIAPFFDFTVNTRPVITLWDAGQGNTLDVSGFAQAATIDLRPGAFSSVDGMVDNIAIAFETAIDAAVGGPGDTMFIANDRGDSIAGGAGNNTVAFTRGGAIYRDSGGSSQVVTWGGVADTLAGIGTLAFTGGADTIVTHAGGAIALDGGRNLLFLGSAPVAVSLGASDTVIAAAGSAQIVANGTTGAGGSLVFANAGGALAYTGGGTPDTVVGAAATVTAGAVGLQAYGVGASLSYQGGAGFDTVACSTGRLLGTSGAGGGLLVGGPAGGNRITATGGRAIVFAGGAGDVITFNNAAPDIAVLAGGPETVQGAGATAGFSAYAGTGDALVMGGPGSDGFVAGSGNSTLLGGLGINVVVFVNGQGGGTTTLADWDPSHDYAFLVGYGAGADAAALATQRQVGADTVISLPDHSQLVFLNTHGVGVLY